MLTQAELCKKGNADHRMSPTKIASVLEEFPWSQKHLEGCLIRQVYVSRVGPELLYYSPLSDINQCFFWTNYTYERIFILDKNGKLLNVNKKSKRKWGAVEYGDPEIVMIRGVAYNRSSVINLVELTHFRIDDIRYFLSYYELTGAVIVYKLSKKVSLMKMINDDIVSERLKLQKKVDTIG